MKEIKRRKWVDHTGERFGKLTIIRDAEPHNNGIRLTRRVVCKCDCGEEHEIYLRSLKPGRIYGCKCFRAEKQYTHRMSLTKTYRAWWGMICRGNGSTAKKYYFDRGIRVCDRWLKFENFFEDMGERPEGLSLDRIDWSKNYEPGNCRWATSKEQARNKRSNRPVTMPDGSLRFIPDLAEKYGVPKNTISYRLKIGMDIMEALTIPVFQGPRLKDRKASSTPERKADDCCPPLSSECRDPELP